MCRNLHYIAERLNDCLQKNYKEKFKEDIFLHSFIYNCCRRFDLSGDKLSERIFFLDKVYGSNFSRGIGKVKTIEISHNVFLQNALKSQFKQLLESKNSSNFDAVYAVSKLDQILKDAGTGQSRLVFCSKFLNAHGFNVPIIDSRVEKKLKRTCSDKLYKKNSTKNCNTRYSAFFTMFNKLKAKIKVDANHEKDIGLPITKIIDLFIFYYEEDS